MIKDKSGESFDINDIALSLSLGLLTNEDIINNFSEEILKDVIVYGVSKSLLDIDRTSEILSEDLPESIVDSIESLFD